ncbi:MAG: hypothetical protein ACYDHX_08035 [Methanothrix sp.]
MKIIRMILVVAMLATACMAVEYKSDMFAQKAPFISMIDPLRGIVEVTNPGAAFDTRVAFIDVFGDNLAVFEKTTLASGKTTFAVPLRDRGTIGIYTDYYNAPVPASTYGLPALGRYNNQDLAFWNMITYLPAHRHPGEAYVRGANGVWGWAAEAVNQKSVLQMDVGRI